MSPIIIFGQEITPIQIDRPDQTESPDITPMNYIQFENGFTYEKTLDNEKISYPSILIRTGLRKIELRMMIENLSEINDESVESGFRPIEIGFKTLLMNENKILPKLSFMTHFTNNLISNNYFKLNNSVSTLRFALAKIISKKIQVGSNIGLICNNHKITNEYLYTITSNYNVSKKIGIYCEFFGTFNNMEKPKNKFDIGITSLINNNSIIDLSYGTDITQLNSSYYISIGLSFRFTTQKKVVK